MNRLAIIEAVKARVKAETTPGAKLFGINQYGPAAQGVYMPSEMSIQNITNLVVFILEEYDKQKVEK